MKAIFKSFDIENEDRITMQNIKDAHTKFGYEM